MTPDKFQESLLRIMERKNHWAWPLFSNGTVKKDKLHIHLEQEYEVYVRDFPVLVGRAFVQCPHAEVRRELAENLYEEETGGLAAGRPHPELFLEYPKGLGMDLERFERVKLLPRAKKYRDFLDKATRDKGWDVATAVVTLFIEGTAHERGELDPKAPKRPETPLTEHPLVKHYGLPLASLKLTKAHRKVEGNHRASAWKSILGHVTKDRREEVVRTMEQALMHWLAYRDDVAAACGLKS
jgi:pyrroloquinoline quinone (PQQ) biosynthesis protein C